MREKDDRWNQHITHLWFSATWVVATDVGKQPGARVAVLAKMLVHQVASVHEVQVQGCWSGWAWSVPAAGQAAAAPIKPDRRQLSAGPRSPARNAQLCTEHLLRGEKIISGICRSVSCPRICKVEVCYHLAEMILKEVQPDRSNPAEFIDRKVFQTSHYSRRPACCLL